jgi:hypothetical protein
VVHWLEPCIENHTYKMERLTVGLICFGESGGRMIYLEGRKPGRNCFKWRSLTFFFIHIHIVEGRAHAVALR